MAGCNRGAENPEAVRTAILDYLATERKLNVANMQVDVTALTFRQNEADASVSIGTKGGSGGPGMTMNYTLEKKGNVWAVKGRSDNGGTPHGAMGQMPGGVPPDHPDMGANPPPETKK